MATSSAEDVPRSLQFLFSRNRLNVAVSRAMCLAVVVASPLLLESRARTIEHMQADDELGRAHVLTPATAAILVHSLTSRHEMNLHAKWNVARGSNGTM